MFNREDNPLWVEKYRPTTVDDTVLPPELKATFKQFVAAGSIPNITLSGGPGIGKTTVAKAMCDELGADFIVINGSMNGNIDTLRNEIQNFASSVSLAGGRKYVILDEADYLNANSTQPALRNFMEEYSKNCGFILTCNFPGKLLEPLLSRAPVIDMAIKKKDLPGLASQFFKRLTVILDQEGIEYEQAVLAELIKKYLPDWRKVLNTVQRYAATGKIDTGILANLQGASIKELVGMMKDKKFSEIRKWVGENLEDSASIFRKFYDTAADYFDVASQAQLVMIIAKYQYQTAFVADHEINMTAFLTECMIELNFQ